MNNVEIVEIKEAFDFLYLNEVCLTLAQTEFIESLKKYFIKNKTLSEKQQKALSEIKRYLNTTDQKVRFSGSFMSTH